MKPFAPGGLPLLIGSLPLDNHEDAVKLVLESTPEIPLWVQLPCYHVEGMIPQFIEGLPGTDLSSEKNMIDTMHENFDLEMIAFFEDFLALSESGTDLSGSRFALSGDRAKGFVEFLKQIDAGPGNHLALKGQVTGPITFCTTVKDQDGRDIFYNDQLRDAAVKKLALNARWQADEYAKRGAMPIIFIDEPALAGFGTSAFLTITKEDVTTCIDEIVQEIHSKNGLAGVHVCGNTQWDLLLESSIDIISFDAFSYFDRFILYPEALQSYLGQGKILAFGIVPTLEPEVIMQQTAEGLAAMFDHQLQAITQKCDIDPVQLLSQILITPSCGTGSLDIDTAVQVIKLTKRVSQLVRQR